jgi:PAS domain S-box-containing protein
MQHTGVYDPTLVALSVLIAVFASYTALDLATRIRASLGWSRFIWLASAAAAMGGGIWSMHFVGMLAFTLPGAEINYDLALTLASLVLPIAVTAFGFFVVSRPESGPLHLVLSGLVVGLGIAAMHYTGMAAMRMGGMMHHQPSWVIISILIAIGAATVALWLAFKHTSTTQRLLAAPVMGLAIAGMHYAAMRGAIFTMSAPIDESLAASVGQTSLALWITGTTMLILVMALVAAMYDRHFADLAEREAATLRQSEERFRLLVQGVNDYAIYMLDTDGRVANWNAGAERIKGYRANEILGQHFSRFYTDEDNQAGTPANALRVAEATGKFEAEGWRVRKDGSRFWAAAHVEAVRNDQGKLVGFAKFTRDISERKNAQDSLDKAREALAQAQKMEAVGQLTGGVAHDFNNLLMAVLGNLELLRKRLPDDARAAQLLDNAMLGAQRGVSLTQRMLAFARRQDLKPAAVELSELVRNMADLLDRSIGPQVRIETSFPDGLPRVMVDANQLELALINLAVNARDAMPKGGTLTISAREGAGGCELPPGRYVCLAVTDNGQGMDKETLARAQEPFFTTKGIGKGTGLGLSMVQGLAEQSKGRLELRSSPGEGTTAEIWLPVTDLAMSREQPAGAPAELSAGMAPLTILAVDDDFLVLENTAAMLEDLGHRVIRASSGEEALRLLKETPDIDLVVTDHAMPGMTGAQLAGRIQAERPGLPLLLTTGYAELPPGPFADLPKVTKPFDQIMLANAVEAVMPRGDMRLKAARQG